MYAEFLSTDEGGGAHTRAATAVRKIENLVTLLRGRGLLPADTTAQASADTPPSDAGEPDSPQPTEAAHTPGNVHQPRFSASISRLPPRTSPSR